MRHRELNSFACTIRFKHLARYSRHPRFHPRSTFQQSASIYWVFAICPWFNGVYTLWSEIIVSKQINTSVLSIAISAVEKTNRMIWERIIGETILYGVVSVHLYQCFSQWGWEWSGVRNLRVTRRSSIKIQIPLPTVDSQLLGSGPRICMLNKLLGIFLRVAGPPQTLPTVVSILSPLFSSLSVGSLCLTRPLLVSVCPAPAFLLRPKSNVSPWSSWLDELSPSLGDTYYSLFCSRVTSKYSI